MERRIRSLTNMDFEEKFLHDNFVQSQIIYIVVVFAVLAAVISLPFIKVSVSVQSRGIIRPVSEIAEIKLMASARVGAVYITEGQKVKFGDTLMKMDIEGVDSRLVYTRLELNKICAYINDLENLAHKSSGSVFSSELYETQFINFGHKLSEIESRVDRANKDLERNVRLYEDKLISKKEYEELLFERDQLIREKEIVESEQNAQWRAELAKRYSEKENYYAQLVQIEKEKELLLIKSPVTGTVETFDGIYPGSFLPVGQLIASISPEDDLVAEIYVAAGNIGFLTPDMPVNIQVDAFNYNEWGVIKGKIIDLSDDYFLINNVPMFRVKCSLEKRYVALKNGKSGYLKKGMTLNARFIVAKRSLLQLIYQKADDWLNPARNLANNS